MTLYACRPGFTSTVPFVKSRRSRGFGTDARLTASIQVVATV